jgi:hypothetical protein
VPTFLALLVGSFFAVMSSQFHAFSRLWERLVNEAAQDNLGLSGHRVMK